MRNIGYLMIAFVFQSVTVVQAMEIISCNVHSKNVQAAKLKLNCNATIERVFLDKEHLDMYDVTRYYYYLTPNMEVQVQFETIETTLSNGTISLRRSIASIENAELGTLNLSGWATLGLPYSP